MQKHAVILFIPHIHHQEGIVHYYVDSRVVCFIRAPQGARAYP